VVAGWAGAAADVSGSRGGPLRSRRQLRKSPSEVVPVFPTLGRRLALKAPPLERSSAQPRSRAREEGAANSRFGGSRATLNSESETSQGRSANEQPRERI